MPYRRLWVLLEGKDDDRFFDAIKPVFEGRYDDVRSWRYAQKPEKKIKGFLQSLRAMNADYSFWRDVNSEPCATSRKNKLKNKYGRRIDPSKVVVVVQEIESWYLAGLDDTGTERLKIRRLCKTDDITKEQFNSLVPDRFDSRIDFMVEILKRFSIDTARQKNKSFDYFMAKIRADKAEA